MSKPTRNLLVQNPIVGGAAPIDTSPQQLGVKHDSTSPSSRSPAPHGEERGAEQDREQGRAQEQNFGDRVEGDSEGALGAKGRIKRAVEKTVDLGRSISGKAASVSHLGGHREAHGHINGHGESQKEAQGGLSQSQIRSQSPRRLFSLNRRGKRDERDYANSQSQTQSLHSQRTKSSPSPPSSDPQSRRSAPTSSIALSPSSPVAPTSADVSDMPSPRLSDDSPFIRPSSPPSPSRSPSSTSTATATVTARTAPAAPPLDAGKAPAQSEGKDDRPSLDSFRGFGSMRAGHQTLIQALQAIPWAADDPDNDDDTDNDDDIDIEPTHGQGHGVAGGHGAQAGVEGESDGSDEDEEGERMASSIHTIYRPVARSRRAEMPSFFTSKSSRSFQMPEEIVEEPEPPLSSSPLLTSSLSTSPLPSASPVSPGDITTADADASDEDEDFEAVTPRLPTTSSPEHLKQLGMRHKWANRSRAGSIATVKMQRRTRLAEKLKEIFELDAIMQVVAEMPCWLLRSILLQGYMYLTNSHLCFFAHMPSREDQVLKSGSLNKKATRTKRWTKHWFILKNDALSWYQSSSDPYFPHGIVDLRYAISCDPVGERNIRLRTNQKTIVLSADSVPSREEWVKAVRKVIFKAQNMGDSVKIAIPYSIIADVEKSSAMDFSETIEVKVLDKEAPSSQDSYFFAYFHDLPAALEEIRDAIRMHHELTPASLPEAVLDTTPLRAANIHPTSHATLGAMERARSLPAPHTGKSTSMFSLSSFLRPFQDTLPLGRSSSVHEVSEGAEDFTHISKRSSASFVPIASSSPLEGDRTLTLGSAGDVSPNEGTQSPSDMATADHTYPPSSSISDLPPTPHRDSSLTTGSSGSTSAGTISSWAVPSWLKSPRKVFSISSAASMPVISHPTISHVSGSVSEVYSSADPSKGRGVRSGSGGSASGNGGDMGFSVLEPPENDVSSDMNEKFRVSFAFDEKEALLGYFTGYIFRLLPVYGRLYVSTNYFCFKSSGPLVAKTRMVIPIRDILSVEKSKATRFGHHGLIIIIKGHEELFFEFGVEDRRSAFVAVLERQMEDVRHRVSSGEPPAISAGRRDALILEEFEAPASSSSSGSSISTSPRPNPENMSDSLPAVMFTSASSTFLTFKPKESLRFTILTIGTRGDVQPYIALAKGLQADGHRARIATHGEFKDWIEGHGIEFGYVGGDPAELMRICVENGMFTVSFLKEGLAKFRGWLDDLFKTSWEACQGTDVLIECPSAMGGYHIAEALRIPYFRAFTMTWTRTRAYPHAFAVPEHKMGGSYNYMSYVMFDQVFWRATAGQINRWRRNVLHLGSTSLDKMEPHKIPFLYNFSPVVVPPPLDWPEWIRVTGYWFLDEADEKAKKWTPPADLVEFIDSAHAAGKKVVYIGFGSIVVSDPKSMTRCVIDAVIQSGVCAILSKGWSDRLHVKKNDAAQPEEPLPKEIYPISSIPHDWLFQRIDAVCHHGGAGTTGASLRAGIPTIIKPFFGDQYFWADRMEALGIGSGVRKLTVENLTEALRTATTDIKQIDRAKLIGEQIRAENGVATAIEALYRDMEYARSLIKRPAIDDGIDHHDKEEHRHSESFDNSTSSSGGSGQEAASESWSVISDPDDQKVSFGSRPSGEGRVDRSSSLKRNSLATAMFSVLPDALTSVNRRASPPAS